MCSRFILEMFSEATPLRGLGSRTGQREKLKCDTVAAESSADPQGNLCWHSPSSCPKLSKRNEFHTSTLISHCLYLKERSKLQ